MDHRVPSTPGDQPPVHRECGHARNQQRERKTPPEQHTVERGIHRAGDDEHEGQEHDKVTALDLGADDYLTKPFGASELLARIRVALRHAALPPGSQPQPVFQTGDLRVDLVRRQVFRGDEEAHLTPTEYKLLAALIRQAGRVITHRQLLQEVWGTNYGDQSHYLRVYMAQLRHKLERDPTRPRLLTTEPGVGYRLREA